MPSEACCVARPKSFLTSALAIVLAGLGSAPAVAQVAKKPPKPGPPIIVYGQRQSAVTDIAPIASVNQDTISAIGATSMGELMRVIKPLAESASGEEPIFLLNGQRISGYQEISALPPEAIAKVEVLPEPAALKFGYPPTVGCSTSSPSATSARSKRADPSRAQRAGARAPRPRT